MQTADPPALKLLYERTVLPELWDQYLISLLEFVLPMDFLKANHNIILGKSRQFYVFSSGKLW